MAPYRVAPYRSAPYRAACKNLRGVRVEKPGFLELNPAQV